MTEPLSHALADLPAYHELLKRRRRIITPLAVLTLIAYYSFILTVAYMPERMGQPLVTGGVTSVGIAFGLGLILLTFAITAFYVWYANTRIDPVLKAIHQKASGHE